MLANAGDQAVREVEETMMEYETRTVRMVLQPQAPARDDLSHEMVEEINMDVDRDEEEGQQTRARRRDMTGGRGRNTRGRGRGREGRGKFMDD